MPVAEGDEATLLGRRCADRRVEREVNRDRRRDVRPAALRPVVLGVIRIQPLHRGPVHARHVGERRVDRHRPRAGRRHARELKPVLERGPRGVRRRGVDSPGHREAAARVVSSPVRRALEGRVLEQPVVREVARKEPSANPDVGGQRRLLGGGLRLLVALALVDDKVVLVDVEVAGRRVRAEELGLRRRARADERASAPIASMLGVPPLRLRGRIGGRVELHVVALPPCARVHELRVRDA